MRYSSGKHSKAICDRCGQKYKYSQLKPEVYNRKPNGLRVCPSCLDKDHPQLQLGKAKIVDAEALRHPRPDIAEVATNNSTFDNKYPHTAGTRS